MTPEDVDPANLTPAQMAQLRADFQSTGMSPAQAAEAADILAGMPAKIDALRADILAGMAETLSGMDEVRAELRAMHADLVARIDRMEADLAAMVQRRRPRA
jgi:uncharacterized protein YicC (UPF0701 family)